MTTGAWRCVWSGGPAGFVALEVGTERAAFCAYLVDVPGYPGVVVVRDDEVPRPRQGLEIRTDGLWSEWWCGEPGVHWTIGCEAFGVRLDAVAEAWPPGGEIGERLPVGLDLEWEAGPDGGTVGGEVLVGSGRFPVEAPGAFVIGVPGGEPDAPGVWLAATAR
ncbi:MAG: hypothetical protein ACKOOG_00970 [Actinomycetota bacterium]